MAFNKMCLPTRKSWRKCWRELIEASSTCHQQFANVSADCFCAVHTHQLEFANTSLPTLVCCVKAALEEKTISSTPTKQNLGISWDFFFPNLRQATTSFFIRKFSGPEQKDWFHFYKFSEAKCPQIASVHCLMDLLASVRCLMDLLASVRCLMDLPSFLQTN